MLVARWLRAIVILCMAVVDASAVDIVKPGERPPRELIDRVAPQFEEARQAMAIGDAQAVRAAVAKVVIGLGSWAGNPETATQYYPPVATTAFNAAELRDWWFKEIDKGLRGLPWDKNPAGDPRLMAAGLREAAFPLDGLARSAMLFPERRAELTKHVIAGADWLVKLQHPSGVFPFPIGPALKPREKVGQLVAKIVKAHPDMVVNDWIPDDRLDGGLQFDNGLCGRALLSAWELTDDERYLAAAQKSGAWAIRRPLVSNWNYNAFSVGLLARLAAATGDETFLDAAIKKADVGVLPGQMSNGRWFDAHNACAVYHQILLRDLLELFHALPLNHPYRVTLQDALTRGLDNAATETLENGYTGSYTENFARGLQWIGEHPRWRDALHACLNASGRNGAPTPGFAAVVVLEGLSKPQE